MDPAAFTAGGELTQEEHEQKKHKILNLLVAHLELDRQRNHWQTPLTMLACTPTVKVGIYIAPCLALALGLPRMALSGGFGSQTGTLRLTLIERLI